MMTSILFSKIWFSLFASFFLNCSYVLVLRFPTLLGLLRLMAFGGMFWTVGFIEQMLSTSF